MLTHYLDLALLPDPEFAVPQLMDALFAKLHRQLVLMQSDGVAVAFPQYAQPGCTSRTWARCCGCWGLSRC
jgi:CRISPR-associated endonuclease Csy4